MEKFRISRKALTVCWGCLICAMLAITCPTLADAEKTDMPSGKIVFEDKKTGVKIIKTRAGVILKITTDEQGRVRVEELEDEPAKSAGR